MSFTNLLDIQNTSQEAGLQNINFLRISSVAFFSTPLEDILNNKSHVKASERYRAHVWFRDVDTNKIMGQSYIILHLTDENKFKYNFQTDYELKHNLFVMYSFEKNEKGQRKVLYLKENSQLFKDIAKFTNDFMLQFSKQDLMQYCIAADIKNLEDKHKKLEEETLKLLVEKEDLLKISGGETTYFIKF